MIFLVNGNTDVPQGAVRSTPARASAGGSRADISRNGDLTSEPSSDIWATLQSQLPNGCGVKLKGGPSRADFPSDFKFGFATAAYQIEGAAASDGRGPSIWDWFSSIPGKILDNSTADVADDSYHNWKDDIEVMKRTGVKDYRFSISWPRLLPDGVGYVNPKGVEFYTRFIDALLEAGIAPAVTLFHWDLPMALYDKYGGWLSPQIVQDFKAYADVCFGLWGEKVQLWFSLNEPDWCTNGGYSRGEVAPGRCSDRTKCAEGDERTEPYVVLHNFLVAHAEVAKLYRDKYQGRTGGQIGLIIDPWTYYPLTDTDADRAAVQVMQTFAAALFFDPIFHGDYPAVVKEHVGDRLVPITPAERALIRGSADFYGLNFYTSGYASWLAYPPRPPPPGQRNWDTDTWCMANKTDMQGKFIGEETASDWLQVTPWGMRDILLWLNERYPAVPIFITENGMADRNDPSIPLAEALCDGQRVGFFKSYLTNVALALREGVQVKGYFAWSLLDNFEWSKGYSERFGIHYIDYHDPRRPRYPKASAFWWTGFLTAPPAASSVA